MVSLLGAFIVQLLLWMMLCCRVNCFSYFQWHAFSSPQVSLTVSNQYTHRITGLCYSFLWSPLRRVRFLCCRIRT